MEFDCLDRLDIMLVTEHYSEILISTLIVDVSRTVHVTYQVYKILDVYINCGIWKILIVLQKSYRRIYGVDCISLTVFL